MKLQTRFEYMLSELFIGMRKDDFEKNFEIFERDNAPIFMMEIRAYGTNGQYMYTATTERNREGCLAFLEFLKENEKAPEEFKEIVKKWEVK